MSFNSTTYLYDTGKGTLSILTNEVMETRPLKLSPTTRIPAQTMKLKATILLVLSRKVVVHSQSDKNSNIPKTKKKINSNPLKKTLFVRLLRLGIYFYNCVLCGLKVL